MELLNLVGVALHQVDRLGIDGRERAPPIHLRDDLPALRLLLVTRGGVDDEEIVGRDSPERDVVGGIGFARPVPARTRTVEETLLFEGHQLVPHVTLAEGLDILERELERRALQVVDEDERIVRVHACVLRARAEQVVGVAHHELVEGSARGDHDRGRWLRAPPCPSRLLPQRSDRAGIAREHGDVQMADVDTEFERVGGNDAEHIAVA